MLDRIFKLQDHGTTPSREATGRITTFLTMAYIIFVNPNILSMAGLFLAALLFTPVIGMVPGFATAPALIVVGVFMFRNVALIDFRTFSLGAPAFLTIILMPLTSSISMGLAFGFVAHIVATTAAGKARDIHPVMWFVGAFSVLEIVLAAAD